MTDTKIEMIKVSDIVADENQPRKMFDAQRLNDLKKSINRFGLINPVVVEKVGNKYLLEDGERRWRVAQELKLEKIPAIVKEPVSEFDRKVRQFHIQEQHEGWSATEKAMATYDVAQGLGMNITQLCELMSLPDTTVRRYLAFADIMNKKLYRKSEIGIEWASLIKGLKNFLKVLYEKNDEVFDKAAEMALEEAIIARIKAGEFTGRSNRVLTKLKDTFTKDFRYVKKFLNTKAEIGQMFVESKAKGAFHLRNSSNHANYIQNHIREYLKNPDVAPTDHQLAIIKGAHQLLGDLLAKVE